MKVFSKHKKKKTHIFKYSRNYFVVVNLKKTTIVKYSVNLIWFGLN